MATKQAAKASSDEGLWPEEIEAMKNIKSGKTKMITKTAEEFLADMDRIIHEREKKEMARKRTKRLGKAN
jgi:hypothetical protein